MLIRTWLFVVAIGIAALPSIAVSQEDVEAAEDGTDSTTGQEAEQSPVDLIPTLQSIESAIRDLIREESEEERQRISDQAAQDLAAQTEMAEWAREMAIAAIASAIFTLGGLILIWRTLKVSGETLAATSDMAIDQKRIGEAQVRAYLSCASATFKISDSTISVCVTMKNAGQSPAFQVQCGASLYLEEIGGMVDHPRVHRFYETSTTDEQFNAITAGGTSRGDLYFLKDFNFPANDGLTKEQAAELFDYANQITVEMGLTWVDVFDDRHRIQVYMFAGIDAGPNHPEILDRVTSGDMEIRTEDPRTIGKAKRAVHFEEGVG